MTTEKFFLEKSIDGERMMIGFFQLSWLEKLLETLLQRSFFFNQPLHKRPALHKHSHFLKVSVYFCQIADDTFFYRQLGSGLSPQSYLYSQGYWGSKLLNGGLVVL